jgi:hypothetical protein
MSALLAPKSRTAFDVLFDLDALITIDDMQIDHKSNPIEMKAMCYQGEDSICVMSIWVKDVHDHSFGGLPYWKAFHFPRAFTRCVEDTIQKGLSKKGEL